MIGDLIVGIDASRNRSGGAVAHLRGLLSGSDPRSHGIQTVHLWAYESLLTQVADQPWLVKHSVPALTGSIWRQLWWQYATLPKLIKALRCNILFNTDAGSVCPTPQCATLSQDMLSFEPGEMQRYKISKARVRLEILKVVQIRSLRRSQLAIFLSEHARKTIIDSTGHLAKTAVIPHGIDERFRSIAQLRRQWPTTGPIRCLNVSNVAPYKHQWHVAEAIAILRKRGYNLELTLVGGGRGPALTRLIKTLDRLDPQRSFVEFVDFVPNERISTYLAQSDLFIFSSSCENLPVTMLEAMASGIPICSSNRGPMPEVLGKNGLYFDPEQPDAIANTIQSVIDSSESRAHITTDSIIKSQSFTWERCANDTWSALANACRKEPR